MEKEINSVIKYFSFFAYRPTLEEIHTFLKAKINKNDFKKELNRLKYTPPQYSIKRKISRKKLNNWRYKAYIKLISFLPQIKLVGLSGSISMMNADLNDDIDLFIITQKERLYTGRFLATIFAYIIGLKRGIKLHKAPNKVCLNLFFDEKNLQVPKFKQTEFVGHEVLQMRPIIIKDNIYERFLEANRWTFRLFPNAKSVFSMKYKVSSIKKILNTKYFILDTFFDKIELILKKLQLSLIKKHQTTEIITNTQLWFHPDDFEKKIKY